ncbi:transmembrane protein 107 isoform X2 [Pangasianodon hypophthalmus]|uniref:transmembrane protein 107 isoform X2 n=1 Tax=Pangasianodon hypophthalmus TaxID=310915 RepID=UPI00147F1004|nr:transmembrane protein 107 isoform X2 [Pangasianodon hypophthalmus]
MSVINSLVPARFLVITAHLVMVITIFWSRGNNVKSCLPLDFTEEQYTTEDNRVIPALCELVLIIAVFGLKKKPM